VRKKIALEERSKELSQRDWDLSTIPINEAEAACIWEYARESETLREGKKYQLGNYHESDKAAVVDNLKWFWRHVPELCFKVGWAEARKKLHGRTGIHPGASSERWGVVRKIIEVPGIVQGEPHFGKFGLRVEIDTRVPRQCIERELREILRRNRPPDKLRVTAKGKDKTRLADYLCWLEVLRLSQYNTAQSPEAARRSKSRSPQTVSRQRSKAIKVFERLFWFLPSADHRAMSEHYKKS
jgi:hypothetical protein